MGPGCKFFLILLGILFVLGLIASTWALAVLYSKEIRKPDEPAATNITTQLPPERRINCFPEQQADGKIKWTVTKEQCERRGCIYDPNANDSSPVPPCFTDPQHFGYRVQDRCFRCRKGGNGFWSKILKPISNATIFDPPFSSVWFTASVLNDNHFTFKFQSLDEKSFEVPFTPPTFKQNFDSTAESAAFELEFTDNPFSFKVIRKSTGAVLFDTSMGGLVLSKRFLQLTTRVPSTYLYGIGENEHPSLRHRFDYKTWPMFARDQPGFGEGLPLYGAHPMYMVVENDGNAHGVFLLNSNAMEYTLIPAPGLIMKTIGGVFDFHLYTGPTPENVVQQHTEYVGRPYIPPYWGLGFHISRWGYKNVDEMKMVVERTRKYGIPLDGIYADIDHMDKMKDFTLDKENFGGLPKYLENERDDNGLRSVVIIDPAVTENATDYDAWTWLAGNDTFVKWPDGSVMMGYVWPAGKAAFPDFFLERTAEVWKDLIVRHSKVLPFEGIWIDMNEPANFGTNEKQPWNWPDGLPPWSLKCPTTQYEDPPYRTTAISRYDPNQEKTARLSDKTLCMEAVQNYGTKNPMRHYDIHSLYGWSESLPTKKALEAARPGKRSFVLTRSTFAGSGHIVSHWSGDNGATWTHLRRSVISMLEMSMFGIPHTGSDICGFLGTTTPELCKRWMQLGAFYPFSRNHNSKGDPDQDPGFFGPAVAQTSRDYLLLRYKLLPYMYTLFYWAHVDGSTVARPLFHEFPRDKTALDVDTQFLLGPSIMVVPVLEEGNRDLTAYMPNGKWFDLVHKVDGPMTTCGRVGENVTFNSDPMVFQRGGSIIAFQPVTPGLIVSTKFTRTNSLELNVIFDCQNKASGSLFWDDGDSFDTVESGKYWLASYTSSFTSAGGSFSAVISHASSDPDLASDLAYSRLVMFGLPKIPRNVTVTGPKGYPPIIGLEMTTNYGEWHLSFVMDVRPRISTAFDVAFSFDRY